MSFQEINIFIKNPNRVKSIHFVTLFRLLYLNNHQENIPNNSGFVP